MCSRLWRCIIEQGNTDKFNFINNNFFETNFSFVIKFCQINVKTVQDTKFTPAEFLQRLNLGFTKFASADTFCRTIFRLIILVFVLCFKIHNTIFY
ncbi:hypothetical protein BpHYR1_032917 [Brachionus plicatilis]|uniref:Uncharacterized protein n=1 Tax=Brachionus plicatilis TaxID=10195 RepID=A0A3M7T4X6_BRAPC|nr:hypothetical protein BpHYR1_032917 [Brachionus plicatilis]